MTVCELLQVSCKHPYIVYQHVRTNVNNLQGLEYVLGPLMHAAEQLNCSLFSAATSPANSCQQVTLTGGPSFLQAEKVQVHCTPG
jgi:hypothetical protein